MNEMTAVRTKNAAAFDGRVEDDALLRGEGNFGDDVRFEGALAATFVRSPHAFARVGAIDTAAAKAVPGVVAVLTGADLAEAHYHSLSHGHPIPGRGGRMPYSPYRPVLADKRVMHVGEPVAMVVAKTAAQAQDAADLVAVAYEEMTPVTDVRAAVKAGAPLLWDEAPGNVGFDWTAPADPDGKKQAAIERAFKDAAHVVKVELMNQRLVPASIETRNATASYDAQSKRYTLRCPTQGFASVRTQLTAAMNIKPDELHIQTGDVGGAFGMKGWAYPEYVAMLHGARVLGKPIHWASSRSEAFVTDNQGRDAFFTAELALSARGKFLAMRVDCVGNLGAYFTGVAHFVFTTHVSGCLPTLYDIPHAQMNSRCAFTNTVPTGPYRGAGRPEASYLMERLVDAAADQTGIDAAELRRRNLIKPGQMPYTTAFGNTYDSGEFPALFERALSAADYAGFAARKKAAKKEGKLRGIGIGCYLEIAGAMPEEAARISFPGGNKVVVSIGAGGSGQGHPTVFSYVAAQKLGIDPASVTLSSGDSDRDVPGFGAVASRSAMYVGGAISVTADKVIEKGKKVAAILLQAGEGEVAYANGKFSVKNREVTLFEVAARAVELSKQGVIAENLDTTEKVKAPSSFPNGCHIAEVQIDPATGAVEIVNYTAVGDSGNLLDETIVTGQIHGGVAQGIGQALVENTVYDVGGQLVTGSFMDYAVPHAHTVPMMKVEHMPVACKTNPLGTKGTGEAGTTAAPPAVMNAILNALPQGARLDMPATPGKVWAALQAGK